MKLLENKIPPPIVTVLFGLVMWGISTATPILEINAAVQSIAILIVVGTGFFFVGSGLFAFKRAKTTMTPMKPETATSLVKSGIYQVSRNPMYVGLTLFLLAWTIYLSAPVALVGALGLVLYMNKFQIEPEERALKQIFGSDFEDYKLNVRRWL